MRGLVALAGLLAPVCALAGAQKYEPLAASVAARMSAAVADQAPAVFNFSRAEDAHRWIHEMSRRLRERIPDRRTRVELLKTVQYEAVRAGLDPQLVLAVIEVESGFRKYAVSAAGARGYMQVMPFWVKLIGRPEHNLFRLRTNIKYGCVILRHYLDMENGDLYRALGRYNGSLGEAQYPSTVVAHWRSRWKYDGATS
ncbi:MAG: transglycosylase SLT domain-containing protein [Pseudomonadota bacterium]